MENPIQSTYDPESFRRRGHELIDLLADHLAKSTARHNEQVMPWQPPDQSCQFWDEFANSKPNLVELADEVIKRSVRISDPRFIGHQICTPAPDAILAGLVADFANNGNGVYEMGIAGVAMEQNVVKQICSHLGLGVDAGGVMTSGGSLGNLTALLCARSVKAPTDVWKKGSYESLAVMVSQQAHYCVDRSARIMGWGDDGVIAVPCDNQYRMRTDLLPELLENAKASGRTVIAVVGSACTTSTGSFDDLNAIASFCEANDLWFHVDGAHGAALTFSSKRREKLAGIERADSVVLDFHKMLMTPVITSAILWRRAHDGFRTFSQQADYLFAQTDGANWHDLAKRTFECTKNMMALKIYSLLAIHGTKLLSQNVDRLIEMTQTLVEIITSRFDFELATEPECNIVCFRYCNCDPDCIDHLNAKVRMRMIQKGQYYLVQTKLNGETWLRCTVTNPLTSRKDFVGLMDELALTATQVKAAMKENQEVSASD